MGVTTWDAGFKAAGITLSNGNLTATSSGAASALVRSTTSAASGLVYWEITFNTLTANVAAGFGTASETTTPPGGIGGDSVSLGFYPPWGQAIYIAGSDLSSGATASANGDVVCFAVNLATRLAWISSAVMRAAGTPWNNSATANPATGTGGIPLSTLATGPYYAFFNDQTGGAVATANFGATAFNQTIPSGFSAWNAAGSLLSGAVSAASFVTGALTGKASLSGSAAAASSVTGTLAGVTIGAITGSATTASSVTGALTGVTIGAITGSATAASAVTGTLASMPLPFLSSPLAVALPLAFTYQASDYQAAMLALGHRGRAWTIDPDTVRVAVMLSLAQTYVRSGARAVNLITDAFPPRTVELLPAWEASLGLPDPCAVQPQTLQQRQAAVTTRFLAAGGQTTAYFIQVAAALGYTITITEFSTFRAGASTAGQPCGSAFAYAWQVNAPSFTIGSFRSGVSTSGEPLSWWGNTTLQCTLRSLAPAHTALVFAYS